MKRLAALLLSLTLLAACAPSAGPPPPTPAPEPQALTAFLSGLNASRTLPGPPPDLGPWLEDYDAGAFTEEETDRLLDPYAARPAVLTAEQAREDIETAFRLLKHVYGAYGCFGGDEVFRPLEAEVLSGLEGLEAPTAADLEAALSDRLSPVLADGRFKIGDTGVLAPHDQAMYYVPNLYFTDLTGRDPAYVRPTIAPDGSIQYCYAALSRDGTDLPDGLGAWVRAGETSFDDTRAFYETQTEGVPTLAVRQLYLDVGDLEQSRELMRFASCGAEYRDAPVLIVDDRANPGGDSAHAGSWFEGFTGAEPAVRSAWAYKCAPLTIDSAARDSVCGGGFLTLLESAQGGWAKGGAEGARVSREGITFVLVDKATAAAGEDLAAWLRTVENAVLVGGNTAGRRLTPGVRTFYLPHSGLPLSIGIGLAREEGAGPDGVGLLPDLWVDPPAALDAVARLCQYYGLI